MKKHGYITDYKKGQTVDIMEDKRIKELEKILNAECGKYENDCSKCPRQKECEEYCKLSGIYEIVNK